MAYAFWGRLGLTKGEQYRQLLERAWNLGWSPILPRSKSKTFRLCRKTNARGLASFWIC